MHNTQHQEIVAGESSNSDMDLEAQSISISEIELREEAVIEWFPGDWQICLTY